MKFKAIFLAAIAVALSGCMVNHAPSKPVAQQSDNELCQSVGFALYGNQADKLIAVQHEIESRVARKTITLGADDCKILAQMGINQAQQDSATNNAMLAGMAKSMEQQQQQPARRMETTHCSPSPLGVNSLGGGFSCTTF
ncbi:hypothetical protein DRT11_23970 [Salmonella enterica subsp. enterica]|nr:hypothetical protein [Salmonella enterica subsp. enterica serovar Bareilly]